MTFAELIYSCPVLPKGKPAFPEKVGVKGHDENGVPLYNIMKGGEIFNTQRGTYLWYVINEGKNFDSPVQCPHCRWIEDLDCFDVMGADSGNIFCLNCHKEFEADGINRIEQ